MTNEVTTKNQNSRSFKMIIKTAAFLFFLFCILTVDLPGDEEKEVIIIPFNEYNNLIRDLGNCVLLPLDEYRAILQKIEGLKQSAESSEAAVIETASYIINPLNDRVFGKAQLQINFLKAGWHKVAAEELPLLYSADSFELDGKPARFLVSDGAFFIFSPETTRAILSFNFHLSFCESEKGISKICVPVIRGLTTTSSVKIESSHLEINTEGAVITGIKESDKETLINLVNTDNFLTLQWIKKQVETAPGKRAPLRMLASVSSLYQPDKGLSTATHLVAVYIQQGSLNEINIEIDPETHLINVIGDNIDSYRIISQRGKSLLIVRTSKPVESNIVFLVNTEIKEDTEGMKILTPVVDNAARQTGFVAVSPMQPALIEEKDRSLYKRIDIRELPPEIGGLSSAEPAAAYQYLLKTGAAVDPLLLSIKFQPTGSLLSAFIHTETATTLLNEDGAVLSKINYMVISPSIQFLRLTLDAGDTLLSVFVNGQPSPSVKEDNIVIIPLKRNVSGTSFDIEVTLIKKDKIFNDEGNYRLTLPAASVPVRSFEWLVYLPEEYEYDEFEGNVQKGSIAEKAVLKAVRGKDTDETAAALRTTAELGEERKLEKGVAAPSSKVAIQAGEAEKSYMMAQTGGLIVSVTDEEGHSLPGATVTVISEISRITRTQVTSSNGQAVFNNLPSGKVTIEVSLEGFQTTRNSGVEIRPQKTCRLNAQLGFGMLRESIEVTGAERYEEAIPEAPPAKSIDISSATLSLRILIPTEGFKTIFHTLILKDDKPDITFNYEKK